MTCAFDEAELVRILLPRQSTAVVDIVVLVDPRVGLLQVGRPYHDGMAGGSRSAGGHVLMR